MSEQKRIITAISVRDKCRSGLVDKQWVNERTIELIRDGFWSDGQIAAIIGWTRAYVWYQRRKMGLADDHQPAQRGILVPASLDILLEVSALSGKLTAAQRALIREAIRMGTSTKLLSVLTGLSLGQILYIQRGMKEEGSED